MCMCVYKYRPTETFLYLCTHIFIKGHIYFFKVFDSWLESMDTNMKKIFPCPQGADEYMHYKCLSPPSLIKLEIIPWKSLSYVKKNIRNFKKTGFQS